METLSIIAIILLSTAITVFFLLMPSIIFKRTIERKNSKDEKLKNHTPLERSVRALSIEWYQMSVLLFV